MTSWRPPMLRGGPSQQEMLAQIEATPLVWSPLLPDTGIPLQRLGSVPRRCAAFGHGKRLGSGAAMQERRQLLWLSTTFSDAPTMLAWLGERGQVCPATDVFIRRTLPPPGATPSTDLVPAAALAVLADSFERAALWWDTSLYVGQSEAIIAAIRGLALHTDPPPEALDTAVERLGALSLQDWDGIHYLAPDFALLDCLRAAIQHAAAGDRPDELLEEALARAGPMLAIHLEEMFAAVFETTAPDLDHELDALIGHERAWLRRRIAAG